jgi:hypothetical protein
VQVDVFVFHAAPKPLDKDVVYPTTLAVHADRDADGLQRRDPIIARELRALIGVENLRLAVLGHGLLERFDAKIYRHRWRRRMSR